MHGHASCKFLADRTPHIFAQLIVTDLLCLSRSQAFTLGTEKELVTGVAEESMNL